MNKTELVQNVAEKAQLSKAQSGAAVDAVFQTVTDALSKGDKVQIAGFGSFLTRERAARKGLNPQTSEPIDIPAVTTPAFKAGALLKKAVRG